MTRGERVRPRSGWVAGARSSGRREPVAGPSRRGAPAGVWVATGALATVAGLIMLFGFVAGTLYQ